MYIHVVFVEVLTLYVVSSGVSQYSFHTQHQAIRDATAYLLNYTSQVDLSDMCTYSLALTTYALTTVGNSSDEHLYNLKKEIKSSVDRKFITYGQAEKFNRVLQ